LEGKEYTYFMIGRKAYKSRQRIWYLLLFKKTTLIFVGNGDSPQQGGNLKLIVQELNSMEWFGGNNSY
jgi:hypothetical protein